MTLLAVGDHAEFEAYDRIVVGTIVAIPANGIYFVVGDDQCCGMFSDGLFRFTERNVRCKLSSLRTRLRRP